MTKTFQEIRTFNGAAEGFLKRNPRHIQTNLGYAVDKVNNAGVSKALREYQRAYSELWHESLEKPMIDCAMTDKQTGVVLTTPKGSDYPYQFDKENLKKVKKLERTFGEVLMPKLNEEWDAKEFEINSHFASILPADLTPKEGDAFKGFCIDPDKETPREENQMPGMLAAPARPVTGGPSLMEAPKL